MSNAEETLTLSQEEKIKKFENEFFGVTPKPNTKK